jgi:8-oxo-dGTP diphosphatase
MRDERPRVEVVAAVLQRPDGSFLLAQRPVGKVYAGYWEFPGGKVEPGEEPVAALARELHEELWIDVERAYPWITREYDYEHAAVRLRFFRVTEWSGELHGRENQHFSWQRIDALDVAPLLPANGPILRALALPAIYGVTNAAETGVETFFPRLERALERGLALVQIRESSLAPQARDAFALRAATLARAHGARVMLNGSPRDASRLGLDGVHLSSRALMALEARPACEWVGASCHDARELERAVQIGADFVVLGPVRDTASHPGAPVLGWNRVRELTSGYPLPVYAIGGMRTEDLDDAWSAGAHGIAAIRSVWGAG